MIPISKPYIGEEEKQAVLDVLDSGMLVQGKQTATLEQKFAEVTGTKFAIATSSGTTALHVALLAHGIGPGDEVITTPFTFFATVSSILYVGATPVFVDINEETFNINPEEIEQAITPKTKAIMPVHLFGYPCDMKKIMDLAKSYHLIVIEDAAQAIGATFEEKSVGSFDTGCFSLYATKNITCGEGGMITTNDEDFANLCKLIRNHGMQKRYFHEILGFNFRMSDLHAAIGVIQMERLRNFIDKRRENASFYNSRLKKVILPSVKDGYGHVWHQYTIRISEREKAIERLTSAGIGTGIFYPTPAYQQKPIKDRGLGNITLPIVERITKEVLSIPVHPLLSQRELETIVTEVNKL